MKVHGDDVLPCPDPGIVAGRLLSTRYIYLRQELRTISKGIQEKYKERLPALQLVTLAACEQVFNRQPLSLPEKLREDAVKYGLRYYQLHLDKLRVAETENGLIAEPDVQHSTSSSKEMGGESIASTTDTILHSTSLTDSDTDQSSTDLSSSATNSLNHLTTTITDDSSPRRPSKPPKIIIRQASNSTVSSTDISSA